MSKQKSKAVPKGGGAGGARDAKREAEETIAQLRGELAAAEEKIEQLQAEQGVEGVEEGVGLIPFDPPSKDEVRRMDQRDRDNGALDRKRLQERDAVEKVAQALMVTPGVDMAENYSLFDALFEMRLNWAEKVGRGSPLAKAMTRRLLHGMLGATTMTSLQSEVVKGGGDSGEFVDLWRTMLENEKFAGKSILEINRSGIGNVLKGEHDAHRFVRTEEEVERRLRYAGVVEDEKIRLARMREQLARHSKSYAPISAIWREEGMAVAVELERGMKLLRDERREQRETKQKDITVLATAVRTSEGGGAAETARTVDEPSITPQMRAELARLAAVKKARENRMPGPCHAFAETGKCKFGDTCRFSHLSSKDQFFYAMTVNALGRGVATSADEYVMDSGADISMARRSSAAGWTRLQSAARVTTLYGAK
jgi:hypothetical protein